MDPIEEAYRTHHERLWRSLLAYTGDAEVATDAAAETYSQALGRGDELVDPAAWIWRTAFRVAGGLLAERSRRWRSLESADVDARTETLADPWGDPEVVEFLDQLKTLSEQQRAIVVLRYSGGLTPSEIATILDTTPNSVRVQLHRAHAHLRERIDRQ